MTRIGLVRESGGHGDIICVGAAANALKHEQPDCFITAYVPEPFMVIANHLYGIDKVVSFGAVKKLLKYRRKRDDDLLIDKYPYLKVLEQEPSDIYYDLFCPGFLYEATVLDVLQYTRCQLFAMATVVKSAKYAYPKWLIQSEEKSTALNFLKKNNINRPLVGVSFRGTCSTRCYSLDRVHKLLNILADNNISTLYFDVVKPQVPLPKNCYYQAHTYETYAALVDECDLILTMDTGLMHLAQALEKPTICMFTSTDHVSFCKHYKNFMPIVGTGTQCKNACNYSPQKGWGKRQCRKLGCFRAESLVPELVFSVVRNYLRKLL